MKKVIVSMVTLSCMMYGFSCNHIVNMGDSALKHYLDDYANSMNLSAFDKKDNYKQADKNLIDKFDISARELTICKLLRRISKESIDDTQRVLYLEDLSKESMLINEKNRLYDKFLSENKRHFKTLSSVSLIDDSFKLYPLVLVKVQEDSYSKKKILYEFRVKNGNITHLSKEINLINEVSFYGDDLNAKASYISYLANNQGIDIKEKKVLKSHPWLDSKKDVSIKQVERYKVVKPIEIDCMGQEEIKKLKVGSTVQKHYETAKGQIYFYDDGIECSAWRKWWKVGVQKLTN